MDFEDARALGNELMNQYWYKMEGWDLAFDNAKRRCGATHFGKKTITLSRHFVSLNDEAAVRETMLHEIAHVIAGQAGDRGHGRIWKGIARQIGARPERCATDVAMPKGRIEGECNPECPVPHNRHRMPPARLLNAYQCNRCGSKVTWRIVK